MTTKLINALLSRAWLRIGLAVALLVVGLAPIGAPILSDDSWRPSQSGSQAAEIEPAQPFMYNTRSAAGDWTQVQRSTDGGSTWHEVAGIPVSVLELVAVAGDERIVYARGQTTLWVSDDAGATWSQTSALPSRPVALAATGEKAGTVYVGTESMGLLRSSDRGRIWQSPDGVSFSGAGGAPVGVTSLAISPEDEQIVYAAPGFWLGTSQARFNPLGVFASVDSGRHWFQVSGAALGAPVVEKIEPIPGKPLAADIVDATGSHRVETTLSKSLLAALDDPDAGVRAAAARAIGLVGDRAAVPALVGHLIQDPDILAGEQIGWAIGRLGDRAAVPALLKALESRDEAIQSRAAYALGLLGAEESVPLLAYTLQAGLPMAQRRAAEALAAVGTPEAMDALQKPLGSAELTSTRNAAMIGLEAAGDRAVASLTAALSDQNAARRMNAAELLGWLKGRQATAELSRALADADPDVRAQAAWALGEIGTVDARQALDQALRSETNAVVRLASQDALARTDGATAQGPILEAGWANGVLAILATIPVSKWVFMTLALGAAVMLLTAGSRRAQARVA